MKYQIKRIILKNGEIVIVQQPQIFEGPIPVIGDELTLPYRDGNLLVRVVWGNWPGRIYDANVIVPLRVEEI